MKKSLKEIGEDTESSYDSLVVVILSGGMGYEPGQIYDRDGGEETLTTDRRLPAGNMSVTKHWQLVDCYPRE